MLLDELASFTEDIAEKVKAETAPEEDQVGAREGKNAAGAYVKREKAEGGCRRWLPSRNCP
jgi:hypothetical protein